MEAEAELFIVTDLKQYAYCPRIVFYERCVPDFRPRTYKMDAGRMAHEHECKRAARRTLQKYGLESGERHFEVMLQSTKLGLVGKIDEVILTDYPTRSAYPVDYKMARQVSPHYRLQLAAYALLLEEAYLVNVSHGYIYLIPTRRVETVAIGEDLRREIGETMETIRRITDTEFLPPPPRNRRRCQTCEFRRACNDL